ncbi:MAG: hypothetical protein ABSA26_01550 [Thermoguttaceae bacterium]
MTEFVSQSVGVSQGQAIHTAPAALRAAAYLRGLDQFDVRARDSSLPESQILFFRRLRSQLEAALVHFEKSAAGWSESVEDFESYTELDWYCNQCEYWMGPAERLDLSQIYRKCADMHCHKAAMTFLEYIAVGALVQITNILVKVRRNPLVLRPRPIRIYQCVRKHSRNLIARELFILRRIKRRFVLWLKASLLRLN